MGSLVDQHQKSLDHLILDYLVPLKDGAHPVPKVINWPKAFFVAGLTPCLAGEKQRSKCLSLLAKGQIPKGTESKYFNTVAFFDHVETQSLKRPKK